MSRVRAREEPDKRHRGGNLTITAAVELGLEERQIRRFVSRGFVGPGWQTPAKGGAAFFKVAHLGTVITRVKKLTGEHGFVFKGNPESVTKLQQ